MDIGIGINIAIASIAFLAIVISIYSYLISKRTLHHQALLDIHKDFRSGEMLSALDAVWDFYRKCENNYKNVHPKTNLKTHLKREYKNNIITENALVSNGQKKIEDTLGYKRRLITHFYIHLASIHKHGILPPKMIFDWWIPSDLEIFDKFIIPLQEASAEMYNISKKEVKFAMKPLKELKEDCDYYHDNNVNEVKKKLYFYSKRWLNFLKK